MEVVICFIYIVLIYTFLGMSFLIYMQIMRADHAKPIDVSSSEERIIKRIIKELKSSPHIGVGERKALAITISDRVLKDIRYEKKK